LLGVFAGGLALVGCGSDNGKPFGQDFPKPEGAPGSGKTDAEAALSPGERRQKEMEESRKLAAKKGKGKQRQP